MVRCYAGNCHRFCDRSSSTLPAGQGLRDIARFVAETRSRYQDGKDLPTLEMEALIRAALGEDELMDGISPEVSLPAQIVILGTLIQDAEFTEAQLEKFIQEVEEAAAEFS